MILKFTRKSQIFRVRIFSSPPYLLAQDHVYGQNIPSRVWIGGGIYHRKNFPYKEKIYADVVSSPPLVCKPLPTRRRLRSYFSSMVYVLKFTIWFPPPILKLCRKKNNTKFCDYRSGKNHGLGRGSLTNQLGNFQKQTLQNIFLSKIHRILYGLKGCAIIKMRGFHEIGDEQSIDLSKKI